MKHTGEELERLLRSYLDPDDEHPDLDDVLFRYADGTLDRQQRAEVDAHLEDCARCREDLADAVAAQRSVERRRRPPAWLIAAALAAIVVAAALLRPRREPAMPPPAASVPAE
jgi:anti-sigma factor ChrR (cupin superfamily)